MDLVATLRRKIKTLPQGDYLLGLRAVLQHIETSYKHLTRGQSDDDDQAFTDAIYRTNQAFEGSIKEAYRVLAGKNPEKKSPFDIEKYLAENSVFKPRVLSQFTTYRTQWRNPSTHDYTLSFDSSEAFLAIASVCAFACVLLDQIEERLAFVKASEEAEATRADTRLPDDDEPARLVDYLLVHLVMFNRTAKSLPIQSEAQLLGSVQGFLSGMFLKAHFESEVVLSPDRPERADLLVSHNGQRVLIEMKRSNTRGAVREGLDRLERLMTISGITDSILYLYYPPATKLLNFRKPLSGGTVYLLAPDSEKESAVEEATSAGEQTLSE